MKMKNYNQFIKESNQNYDIDIIEILNILKDADMNDILDLRDSLEDISYKNENLNENIITDLINNIKIKFRKKLDNRIWNYLIDRKRDFYTKLIDKLNIFDLTSLDDVFKNYPGLKLDSLYLAGGMDKAKDVGAGWRNVVEHEFEKFPGKNTNLPEISLNEFGIVEPKRVVDGHYVDMFIENPNRTKKIYNKPLILNPVRKEVDRTKDIDFSIASKKYKTFDYQTEPDEYQPTISNINRTMSKSIEYYDEHLVRICDFIFLGLNKAASAGTFGELQTQSFMNKPIFVYMTENDWSFEDFSMWTIPHICKFARNTDEMKILVKTIIDNI